MNIPAEISASLNQEQLSFLHSFFQKCPNSFIQNIMLKTYPKNYMLINTDDTCSHVFILLKGRLQAIEERTETAAYSFGELAAIEILGDFELFANTTSRMVTLTTLEPSLCIVISANAYLEWIQTDANALFLRIQMLMRQMTAQSIFDRQNLFWDNNTRMMHFLCCECQQKQSAAAFLTSPPNAGEGAFLITRTHAEIASKLGCSIRTTNRIISQLHEDGIISIIHGKIQITGEQYAAIRSYLSII